MYWLRNYHRHRMKVGVYSHHHQSVYIFHNMVDNTPTANIENFITTWKNFLPCLVCFWRTVLIKQKFKESLKKSPLSYLASKFNTWKERIRTCELVICFPVSFRLKKTQVFQHLRTLPPGIGLLFHRVCVILSVLFLWSSLFQHKQLCNIHTNSMI